MSRAQKIIKVVFDKNMNVLLQSDPVFSYLFPNIVTLTSFNTFLAKNKMLDENFLAKLNIHGKEHHVCYKNSDLAETFEFEFFLLDDEWMIINPTGRHDIHDQLTGVLTERSLVALLDHEIKSFMRDKKSYTAVMIDIAHLQDINETFGYIAGDTIVKTIASLLQEHSRGSDPLGRFQGDKFIIMLDQTDKTGAEKFIKKVQKALLARHFHFSDLHFNINVDYALTLIQPNDDVDTLVERLQNELKEVKRTSTNQIQYFT